MLVMLYAKKYNITVLFWQFTKILDQFLTYLGKQTPHKEANSDFTSNDHMKKLRFWYLSKGCTKSHNHFGYTNTHTFVKCTKE